MLTKAEREARAIKVRRMLDEGLSLSQIARELGITSQSVHKYILSKGWKTAEMKARSGEAEEKVDPRAAERQARMERRKSMTTRVDRSGGLDHNS